MDSIHQSQGAMTPMDCHTMDPLLAVDVDSNNTVPTATSNKRWHKLSRHADTLHSRIPLLRTLPLPALAIIFSVATVNALLWAAVGVVLRYYPRLTGTAVLAYTLGLRHALDADHISAIDLMTRRLVAAGRRPVAVGTFFSLGHSTIVIVTSIVVAATAASLTARFDSFSRVGGIIGSSVSSAFLLLLGCANAYLLWLLVRQMRRYLRARRAGQAAAMDDGGVRQQDGDVLKIEGGGCLFRVLKRAFAFVDRSWKMYPLGVLFGLGFDTSSEVALLGISSIQASRGTSLWLILIFPLLFTAGMCLLDTCDGALMMSLYTSTQKARDPLAVLYYNVVLTCLTVMVAAVIGVLQLLGLVVAVAADDALHGAFWDGVRTALDRYDVIGGGVCAAFVVVGVGSVLVYPHWRRRVTRGFSGPAEGDVTDARPAGASVEPGASSEGASEQPPPRGVGQAASSKQGRLATATTTTTVELRSALASS